MLAFVLILLFVLWLLGYGPLQVLSMDIFKLNGHIISIWDLLIFFVLIWLIDLLPSPVRQIAAIMFIIWVIASLGFILIPGLQSLLIISIVIGLLVYLVGGKK